MKYTVELEFDDGKDYPPQVVRDMLEDDLNRDGEVVVVLSVTGEEEHPNANGDIFPFLPSEIPGNVEHTDKPSWVQKTRELCCEAETRLTDHMKHLHSDSKECIRLMKAHQKGGGCGSGQ